MLLFCLMFHFDFWILQTDPWASVWLCHTNTYIRSHSFLHIFFCFVYHYFTCLILAATISLGILVHLFLFCCCCWLPGNQINVLYNHFRIFTFKNQLFKKMDLPTIFVDPPISSLQEICLIFSSVRTKKPDLSNSPVENGPTYSFLASNTFVGSTE